MYSIRASFALYFVQLDNNKKYMYLTLFKIIVRKEWFQSTIWLLYFQLQSPPSLPPPSYFHLDIDFFTHGTLSSSPFIPLPTLLLTCSSSTSYLLPTGCQYFLHNKLSLFPFPISHPSIHPFIHWSTSSALPPAIFPPFINHSLPFILSSCCGKRSSMKCQENRDRRKMPTNPGDMLQGHNYNQSRKISVPIRRWLEIKLYKLTLYARRTWTVNNETIWRNQMAQRPTVTQMSRKFESHAFTLPFIIS